jgi:hypothetical protein
MTYIKCTCNKVKMLTSVFWLSAIVLAAFFGPVLIIPIAVLAMFNFAYLMLDPIPVPVILAFSLMIAISAYTIYLTGTHLH